MISIPESIAQQDAEPARLVDDAQSFIAAYQGLDSNSLSGLRGRFDLCAEVGAWSSARMLLNKMELQGIETDDFQLLDMWLLSRIPSSQSQALQKSEAWLQSHQQHSAFASISVLRDDLLQMEKQESQIHDYAILAPVLSLVLVVAIMFFARRKLVN